MRVLFTSSILEYPAAGGPQLRIENSIKALSRVCQLDIFHRSSHPSPEVEKTDSYFKQYASVYRTLFDYPASRLKRRLVRISRIFFPKNECNHIDEFVRHINEYKVDVVWFGYGNISYALIKSLRQRLPTQKFVCDTDSVWSRYIMRELPFAYGLRKTKIKISALKKEQEEKDLVGLCNVTTAVSEVDAEYYRGISQDLRRIRVFSNVIDLANYQDVPDPPVGFIKPCIFLAGSYGPGSAMNMAANWIFDEVFPILLKDFPNLHLYLVGRNSDKEFGSRAGENVTVTGKVESVLPYLCHADVALVPLKFESGTRFKILEAGACQVPLVSTTLGAEGIPVVDRENIMIADNPEEFSNAVSKILSDSAFAKNISTKCYDLIRNHYSIDTLVIEANMILEYLENV